MRRIPGGGRQSVFAYKNEIDQWLQGEPPTPPADAQNPSAVISEELPADDTAVTTPFGAKLSPPHSKQLKPIQIVLVLLFVVLITSALVARGIAGAHVEVSGERQLTVDDSLKVGLVTDGSRLYFGRIRDGRSRIATVSVDGGAITELDFTSSQARPEDVSPNGDSLLALAWDSDVERERALWIVPLNGSPSSALGKIKCHSAAWSPDGMNIAFAAGRSIFLTNRTGSVDSEIRSFDGIPSSIRWSSDGTRIRFQLNSAVNGRTSLWEMKLTDPRDASVESLTTPQIEQPSMVSTKDLDQRGRAFLGTAEVTTGRIFFFDDASLLGRSPASLVEVKRRPGVIQGIAADAKLHKLYFLAGDPPHNELEWFDRSTHSVRPYLPGKPAHFVDFSRDGRSITYIVRPENTLWVSEVDGTHPRRIEIPTFDDIELPRWSPDGKSIAFMAKAPGEPYRIYLIPVFGGVARQVTSGTDNQGAPSWSPDGKWIAYGNVKCEEIETCALHRIEVATGNESTILGSRGMRTARWSPNGRYIAALQPDKHEVFVLDLSTNTWRKLCDGIYGDDLVWSGDSQYLYASRPAEKNMAIARIRVRGGKTNIETDLSDFGNLYGEISPWFTRTPNGSIVFLRQVHVDQIYSLDYRY